MALVLAEAFNAMKSTVLVSFQRGFRIAVNPLEAALLVRFHLNQSLWFLWQLKLRV